ncbi:hypothetical protein N836_09860 [Leptolyngbya sp. Heron Island J]|uniref:hypothetical protein n=1 Tax=Leptolyngbya sp. Heron Island J TaxID=1385935 RepID=UPI0003B965B5|nr:hypothetical protein [Leptolyngbya sp. Heron Island J]ESA35823.1 hypothetical protein N836_09860 [Leptolyngbya sp. Heron Island J]
MKKTVFNATFSITLVAAITSLYVAILQKPTTLQNQIGDIAHTITTTGITVMFNMLEKKQNDAENR